MSKKSLFIFILLLNTSFGFSQEKKLFFDIQSGFSVPMGKYASNDLLKGSFTTVGFNFALKGTWMLKHSFGIRLAVLGSLIPVDAWSLSVAKLSQDPFLEFLTIRSEPYTIIATTGEIVYHKRFAQKWICFLGLGLGLMYAQTPHQLYKADYFMVGRVYSEITSTYDYGMAYDANFEIEYLVNDFWSLVTGLSYIQSNVFFKFRKLDGTLRIEDRNIILLNNFLGVRLKL